MSDAAKVIEQLGGIPVSRARAPFLYRNVQRLSLRAGIGTPRIYILRDAAPNACAVGLSENDTAVAVTTGLLKHFDENEIEAVLAHEVGHIQKDHTIAKTAVAAKALGLNVVAAISGQLIHLSEIDFTPGDDDANDFASTLMRLFAGVLVQAAGQAVATHMLKAVSFDSEFEADECGGVLSGKPWALASALRRIEEFASSSRKVYERAVSQLFIVSPAFLDYETHPPTTERIARLEEMKAEVPRVQGRATVFCPICGEKSDADGKYCYWCGAEIDMASTPPDSE